MVAVQTEEVRNKKSMEESVLFPHLFFENGASGRNRTGDTGIFSPLLYQLSYRGKMAIRRGLEPLTSSVTGWHSNQLNYRTAWWEQQGSNL